MKIICTGNRYIHPDGAALWLYDEAIKQTWPESVQWVEGGLGGLNLMPHFDTRQKVLLLDYMPDRNNADTVPLADVIDTFPQHYDHTHALQYLLQALSILYVTIPSILLIACNPADENWQPQLISRIKRQIEHDD